MVKDMPSIEKDGKIKQNITIVNKVLNIENKLKYENEKWYSLGDDKKWYFLGFGACPSYETDDSGILDNELFNVVFEKVGE